MTTPQNRADDKTPKEIERLIFETPNPETRAVLFVLNSMNKELKGVVELAAEMDEKLDGHISEDAELKNKGLGAAKVLAWVIGLAQVVGLAMWIQIRTDFREIATGIAQNRETNVSQEVKINGVERSVDKMLDKQR